MRVPKGKLLKNYRKDMGECYDSLKFHFPRRNNDPHSREACYLFLAECKNAQNEYIKWYEEMLNVKEASRSRNYNQVHYEWDKENIRKWYTKWDREDLFLSKESLKRTRRYEKKNNLRAFYEIEEEERKLEIRKKEKEREKELFIEKFGIYAWNEFQEECRKEDEIEAQV